MKQTRAQVVAFVVAVGLVGASAFVVYRRASFPLRRLAVGTSKLGPYPRFVAGDQALSVAYAKESGLQEEIWLLEPGRVVRTLPAPALRWTRRSGREIEQSDDGELELRDPLTGAVTGRPISLGPGRVYAQLSPAEDLVAALTSQDAVEVRSMRDGSLVAGTSPPERPHEAAKRGIGLHFSPRADLLAVTWALASRSDTLVYRLPEGKLVGSFVPEDFVAFSATGDLVFVELQQHLPHALVLRGLDGNERWRRPARRTPAVSASGEWVATVDLFEPKRFTVTVLSLATKVERRRIDCGERVPLSVALSAEGERLAVSFFDGTIDVWDVSGP
jgi:hypothetical protein